MVACMDSTVLVIEVRPLFAACRVLMPFAIASRMPERSDAREERADEVKKLVGLSRAELTFLPVARRFCVMPSRLAVFCRASRFCRTPADRVIFEAMFSNLSGRSPYRRLLDTRSPCMDRGRDRTCNVIPRKRTWLTE